MFLLLMLRHEMIGVEDLGKFSAGLRERLVRVLEAYSE